MIRTVVSALGCSIILLAGVSTTGCVAIPTAQSACMVPASPRITKTQPGSVSVKVSGGEEINSMMWKNRISNSAFQTALTEGLLNSRSFEHSYSSGNSDYKLEVILVSLEQPPLEFETWTVTLTSLWTLSTGNPQSVVWKEAISTTHTTKVSDAPLAGIARLQMANEGAARKNIEVGIQRLAMLNLAPNPPTVAQPPQPIQAPSELSASILQKIETLKKLRSEGVLTSDEYETKKALLIQQL